MKSNERIKYALEETEILREPEKLISTSESTTLHYYILTEPVYLEVFENEGPETRIREGEITWDKPKLLTPEYILKMEGFSKEAKKALQMVAKKHPDLAGLLYKMKYEKNYIRTRTVSKSMEQTLSVLKKKIGEENKSLTVVIKGVEELWDVSLMKYIQELILKSAYKSQYPDYSSRGYISTDKEGMPLVTRNLEGLPLAAREEIEQMFAEVKTGDRDPAELKQELDRWGVFNAYQDRFFDLFRKE
ncbi:MAG: hypothetical protein ACOCQH_02590 [Halanaerobiales bacterium]